MTSADLQKALLDPTSVFQEPSQVLTHKGFSRAQKIEILRRWAYDSMELETADNENMAGGTADVLEHVLEALHSLGATLAD